MAKKTNKNFLEGIRAGFNNLGMSEETADTMQKAADDMINPVVQEPENTHPEENPEKTEQLEKHEEAEKESSAVQAEKKGESVPAPVEEPAETAAESEKPEENTEAVDKNLFDEAVQDYEGFGVIKNRKTGKLTAIGLKKAEDEKYITALLKDKAAIKDKFVDYAYLSKESLAIFRYEYESNRMAIESLDKGLITVVGLDEQVKADNEHYDKYEDIDAKLERAGFLRDIDQLGEPRKTSTYLPDEYIQYCSKRASEFKIYKGPVRWVLTNLLRKDILEHGLK